LNKFFHFLKLLLNNLHLFELHSHQKLKLKLGYFD
jgi:hypothetical protein